MCSLMIFTVKDRSEICKKLSSECAAYVASKYRAMIIKSIHGKRKFHREGSYGVSRTPLLRYTLKCGCKVYIRDVTEL